jgi:hypothetical protein
MSCGLAVLQVMQSFVELDCENIKNFYLLSFIFCLFFPCSPNLPFTSSPLLLFTSSPLLPFSPSPLLRPTKL